MKFVINVNKKKKSNFLCTNLPDTSPESEEGRLTNSSAIYTVTKELLNENISLKTLPMAGIESVTFFFSFFFLL